MFVVVILKQILAIQSFSVITVNCLVNIYLCEFPSPDCEALKVSCACVLSLLITVLCNCASRQERYSHITYIQGVSKKGGIRKEGPK